MKKVCINTRDELLIIDLDRVAFFQANGNYTRLTYISGHALTLNTGLSGVEKILSAALPKGANDVPAPGTKSHHQPDFPLQHQRPETVCHPLRP